MRPAEAAAAADLEALGGRVAAELRAEYPCPRGLIASLLVLGDADAAEMVMLREPDALERVKPLLERAAAASPEPVEYRLAIQRRDRAARIAARVVSRRSVRGRWSGAIDGILMHPVSGLAAVFLVLYAGLYKFVGEFGAGTVVDFLEGTVFEGAVNPFLTRVFERAVPWALLRDLFTGEYGVLTLGVRYAVSLILPIVTFFFFFFALVEDSGYLPRLAMLLDRIFKRIGLSGRAVIPMVLGFGCVTMATLVTRTLPTKRERLIATFLLALAVPCAAQLGVILALLSRHPEALLVWAAVNGTVFLAAGLSAARLMPGAPPSFYMELPPLRVPNLANVVTKTAARVKWYFIEILPVFLWASAFIWIGTITGLFDAAVRVLAVPLGWIGLPDATAPAFLFGFFRRDYGAAGLFDLDKAGVLSVRQMVVACVALTLFLPCVAQFLVNMNERGWKTGIAISAMTLGLSFAVAFMLNAALAALGIFA